jgi:leader peptidase (prepilin peptidase)/N-methyltransferase
MIVEWIIILLFGVFMGNFATSAIFRLPRNIPVFGIKKDGGVPPHCSSCGHHLRVWEYFPVIGWMMCLGKCRYCKVKIPTEYFLAEVIITVCAVIFYQAFGLSEVFILSVLMAMALVVLFIIEAKHALLPKEPLFALSFLAIIHRVMVSSELLPIMMSGLIIWIIGVAFTRRVGDNYRRLSTLGLCMSIGFLLPIPAWPVLFGGILAFGLVGRVILGSFRWPLALISAAMVAFAVQ